MFIGSKDPIPRSTHCYYSLKCLTCSLYKSLPCTEPCTALLSTALLSLDTQPWKSLHCSLLWWWRRCDWYLLGSLVSYLKFRAAKSISLSKESLKLFFSIYLLLDSQIWIFWTQKEFKCWAVKYMLNIHHVSRNKKKIFFLCCNRKQDSKIKFGKLHIWM